MNRIDIYSSKKKSVLLLLGSCAFVATGIFLLRSENISLIDRALGIAAVIFFGIGIFISIKRIIKSELCLIIDTNGINVNPRKNFTEFIPWRDISGFEEIEIKGTRIIIIGVNDPEHWLNKETNIVKKKAMQFNMSNYNSPFGIAAAGLDMSSDKLLEILTDFFLSGSK